MKPRYKLYLRPPIGYVVLIEKKLLTEVIINYSCECIVSLPVQPKTNIAFMKWFEYPTYKKINIPWFHAIRTELKDGLKCVEHAQHSKLFAD